MGEQRKEPAIGIDLGTTYSCVAVWQRNRVEVITNDQGNRVTPSCVAFHDDDRFVGDSAMNQAATNPSNTIFGVKRLIGRRWEEQTVQDDIKLWPFRVVQGTASRPVIVVDFKGEEKKFSPEQLSSMVLAKMREVAEAYLGTAVKSTVITVPAYFNDSQRRATKDAGVIAGLNVLRMINEPTAAAFAYGLNKMPDLGNQSKHILIFDLGGGTLDVTILLMKQGVLEVKSTAGNPHLGGYDFDSRMVKYVAGEFKKKKKLDVSGNPRMLRRLRTACERAKRTLSFQHSTFIEVDCLMNGVDLCMNVSRAKFEELNKDLFDNCKVTLEQCVSDLKGVSKSNIDQVVLVGGSTRMPKIQEMLKEFFNKEALDKSINPEEAVAMGAAIQAAKEGGTGDSNLHDIVLLDVTPLSLGVETRGGVMTVLIDRSTAVPVRKELVFSTAVDGQTCVEVKVYEGERTMTRDNHLLGVFKLDGIPPAPERVPHIHISFSIDADGILTVAAEDKSSGLKEEMVLSYDHGQLRPDEIERMVEEAERYRREDEEKRRKVEARNGLESYLSSVRHKIRSGKLSLLSGDELRVEAALRSTSDWFEINQMADPTEFNAAKEALEKVWTEVLDATALRS